MALAPSRLTSKSLACLPNQEELSSAFSEILTACIDGRADRLAAVTQRVALSCFIHSDFLKLLRSAIDHRAPSFAACFLSLAPPETWTPQVSAQAFSIALWSAQRYSNSAPQHDLERVESCYQIATLVCALSDSSLEPFQSRGPFFQECMSLDPRFCALALSRGAKPSNKDRTAATDRDRDDLLALFLEAEPLSISELSALLIAAASFESPRCERMLKAQLEAAEMAEALPMPPPRRGASSSRI